jgi:chaperonin GroES
MLNLEGKIKLDLSAIQSPNLCDRFSEDDLKKIGAHVFEAYTRDKDSRLQWEIRMEAAMDLAMQVQQEKTFPWTGCSNVAFPLVTIAALQFHARAYPTIVNGRSVVSTRVLGEDPTGNVRVRADKIAAHMSYQLLEQDESWEEGQDRALLNVAIVGVGWKKTYYDADKGYPVSQFVPATDLVVNYWATSIEEAQSKTHIIPMFKNILHARCKSGVYVDCTNENWYQNPAPPKQRDSQTAADNRKGATRPDGSSEVPFNILEQHCWLDLDKDGYAEPYIVTIEESSQCCLRIVTRFDREEDIERNTANEIIRIHAVEYFTKIPFIPSPDGGILDIGFGSLIGPLNESVNSSINQLFDAGTIANTAGGFLGRGAKLRGGVIEFNPFSWNRVDATGDDLRKSIFPLPVREPSNVMFNLLSLLIDYTNRISGSTDMLVGENPGQNTPAETARTMTEQGQKIYSAIFKRIWRSMKNEFKKVYQVNAVHLPMRTSFGQGQFILREDYSAGGVSVIPVADPTIASEAARYAQAAMLRDAAGSAAGYNRDAVERRFLKALGVDDIDVIFPGSDKVPAPQDVKVQLQQMKNQVEMARLQQAKDEFTMTLQETIRLNNAKIFDLMAKAASLQKSAQTEEAKLSVEAFRAAIEAMREDNKRNETMLDRMMEERKNAREAGQSAGTGILGVEDPSSNQSLLPMAGA